MSLLFPVINFYTLFSPCWLQHEFVSSSCVLEYSRGECAGPRRHRMVSGWEQISGLLLSRHAYPLSPQPPDLQLEGRSLHVYTDSASLRGTAVSVALVSPWCLLLWQTLTAIPSWSHLAVCPTGRHSSTKVALVGSSPTTWDQGFLPPWTDCGFQTCSVKSSWGQEELLRDEFLLSALKLPEGHCGQGQRKAKGHLSPWAPPPAAQWGSPKQPHQSPRPSLISGERWVFCVRLVSATSHAAESPQFSAMEPAASAFSAGDIYFRQLNIFVLID